MVRARGQYLLMADADGASKASDVFVAALCWECHRELDHGMAWDQGLKVAIWTRAHQRTVMLGVAAGAWPGGVPLPPVEIQDLEPALA